MVILGDKLMTVVMGTIIVLAVIGFIWEKFGGYVLIIGMGALIFLSITSEYGFNKVINVIYFIIALSVIGAIAVGVWGIHFDKQANQKRKKYYQERTDQILKDTQMSRDELLNYSVPEAIARRIDATTEDYWKLICRQLAFLNKTFTTTRPGDRDLINSYNLISSIESLAKRSQIVSKNADVPLIFKSGLITNENIVDEYWQIINQYKRTRSGKAGEKRVRDAISYQNGMTKILSNVNIPFNYGQDAKLDRNTNQMDMVLINEQGIFIIEVKNSNSKYVTLLDSGKLSTGNSRDKMYIANYSVTNQMEKHRFAIKGILPDSISVEPVSILVVANDDAVVRSNVPYLNIYKPNTFYSAEIARRQHCLSKQQIEEVYQSIQKSRTKEQTYDFPVFEDNFINVLLKANQISRIVNRLVDLTQEDYGD